MSGNVLPFPTPPDREENIANVLGRNGQLKKAYQPPEQFKKELSKEGQRREDIGYRARWVAFWSRVVKAVAAYGAIGDIDMNVIEEFVRRTRLAELHRYEAELEPYQTYQSGYIAAHPGFNQSRQEARLARALAADLGLTPAIRRAAGVAMPRPDSGPQYNDDQAGL